MVLTGARHTEKALPPIFLKASVPEDLEPEEAVCVHQASSVLLTGTYLVFILGTVRLIISQLKVCFFLYQFALRSFLFEILVVLLSLIPPWPKLLWLTQCLREALSISLWKLNHSLKWFL